MPYDHIQVNTQPNATVISLKGDITYDNKKQVAKELAAAMEARDEAERQERRLVIDFSNVKYMAHGFADEMILLDKDRASRFGIEQRFVTIIPKRCDSVRHELGVNHVWGLFDRFDSAEEAFALCDQSNAQPTNQVDKPEIDGHGAEPEIG